MRNFIKQNFGNIFTAFLFAAVIAITLCFNLDYKLFLGILGIIATFYFGMLKHKIENDRVFQELFTTFNKRYDMAFNDLINSLRDDPEKQLEINKEKTDKNLIIDYFNLCAEEYLWYSKNRIPKCVWEAWKAGILENLEVKQVREVFKNETKTDRGKKSYYGLIEELGV